MTDASSSLRLESGLVGFVERPKVGCGNTRLNASEGSHRTKSGKKFYLPAVMGTDVKHNIKPKSCAIGTQ